MLYISTIVGNSSVSGYNGDGGRALWSKLNHPQGVYADAGGNVFIADTRNKVIRQVSSGQNVSSLRIISTIAGVHGAALNYSGDGGLAIEAHLNLPTSLAGYANQLYIVDTGNFIIRLITLSTGIIENFAGTPGFQAGNGYGDGQSSKSAAFMLPTYIAVDMMLFHIIVSDTEDCRIRKIDSVTDDISTIAGTSSCIYSGDGDSAINASLNHPRGIAIDFAGKVYISDTGNFVIRQIDIFGIISTVAGIPGMMGYSGDQNAATLAMLGIVSGISVDSSGNLLLVDTLYSVIRKVDVISSMIRTVAGIAFNISDAESLNISSRYMGEYGPALNVTMNQPIGIFVNWLENDTIYVTDTSNNRIRMLSK